MTSDIDDPKTGPGDPAVGAVPEPATAPDRPEAAAGADPALEADRSEPEPEHKRKKGKDSSAERELLEARRENEALRDRYLRAAAEMDNLRKRMEREKSEFFQFALADLLKELLSVLDNFERALQSAPGSDAAGFQEGIGLIHKQLTDLLRRRGVTPIEAADAAFDPAIQQAIVTEASNEVEEPKVAEELQRGYRLHDRLLRPALVKVLVPGKD
jgi:molecular chaperone GrpE